ncbi:MAG: hexokinase family protein, partial [Planctomycetota bacterium]
MANARRRATDFLLATGMHADSINAEETLNHFLAEMDAGLNGKESSLAMIPTYIECDREVPVDEPVIVMDAGGTNLRVCLVTFDAAGHATIDHFSKHQMPGIAREISREEFYATLCEYVLPVADKSDRIGFCFSYPSEITPEKDGKLIHWTKEVKVPEVEGDLIGAGLLEALAQRGHTGKRLVLLNDTVACLLAGKALGD